MTQTKPATQRKTAAIKKQRRKKHALRTSKSDARRREEGLTRISIWVPSEHVARIKTLARSLVENHRAPAPKKHLSVTKPQVELPRPYKNPKPKYDRRQLSMQL